jgi:hypothetical protein
VSRLALRDRFEVLQREQVQAGVLHRKPGVDSPAGEGRLRL